ncbi:hypothetical protein, partial [Yersinia enterocolitica]|uniref:hypothetical protein n=1 Tax=Yersinia enterocolitica TaxID=630 RepID=UPI000A593C07
RPAKRAGVAGIALRAKSFDTLIYRSWAGRGAAFGWVGNQCVFMGARAWRASGGVWREVLGSLLFRHEKAARFGGYDIQNYQLTICKPETRPAYCHQ